MPMIEVDEHRLNYALGILNNECTELYEHYNRELCYGKCEKCKFRTDEMIKEWLRKED